MTGVMMMAPLMGMPKMDIAALLGSLLSDAPPMPERSPRMVGLLMRFMIGTVILSSGYALTREYLPGFSRLFKGLIYGLLV